MIGTRVLEEKESKHNGYLRVLKTIGFGTYIQADGLTQSGGIVESIWKQTLKKVKSKKEEVKNCLILGLGGGTIAKLVRKVWVDARIVGVDIDPMMVELGKKYLGLNGADVVIKIQDAGKPVSGSFDLVIVDLYSVDKFPKKFESKSFLKSLIKYHTVVFNRLSFKNNRAEADKFGKKLGKYFRKVEIFRPITNIMYICTT